MIKLPSEKQCGQVLRGDLWRGRTPKLEHDGDKDLGFTLDT